MDRIVSDCYRLLKPLLFSLDPETAHDVVFSILNRIDPHIDRWIKRIGCLRLEQNVAGVKFPSPIGLAAGMDKEGIATNLWAFLGFGFAEVGTVTPFYQGGNPRPRIFRATDGLINRMGFPSSGMEQVARNLSRRTRKIPIGVNIGPNKGTNPEKMVVDLACAAHCLKPHADYLTINLSSPNTPGLRDNLKLDRFVEFFKSFYMMTQLSPFVKLSPDMADDEIREFCDCLLDLPVAGVIATNTAISPEGGVSGVSLRERALNVVQIAHERFRGRKAIIASGGVMNLNDVILRIRAGANLVQLFTGMIEEGPGLAMRLSRGLVSYMRWNRIDSLEEMIGVPWDDSSFCWI